MLVGGRDDLHRAIAELRDANGLLTEQVRQLTDALAPNFSFPHEWRLTPTETRLLQSLYAADSYRTKDQLHIALSGDVEVETDEKLVDVVTHKVRRKIAPFGLTIGTQWGLGYFLEAESRARITRALAGEPSQTTETMMSREIAVTPQANEIPGRDRDAMLLQPPGDDEQETFR